MQNFESFSCTKIGSRHIRNLKPCQDASFTYSCPDYSLAIVADGHGGEDYFRSDRGASYICNAASECIDEFVKSVSLNELRNERIRPNILRQLFKSILLQWYNAVHNDLIENPIKMNELSNVSDKAKQRYLSGTKMEKAYGTTLVLIFVTQDYWIGIQQGDGKCVAFWESGVVTEPIPWDERCFLNVCTSICDEDALDSLRYVYSEDLPAALFIGSDGIDDSYTSMIDVYSLYEAMALVYLEDGINALNDELNSYLPKLSYMGSGDDLSVAGILSCQRLEKLKMLFTMNQKIYSKTSNASSGE